MKEKKEQVKNPRARLIDMSSRGKSGFVDPEMAMFLPDATLHAPSKRRPRKRPPTKWHVVPSPEPIPKRLHLCAKAGSRGVPQSNVMAPQMQPPDTGSVQRRKVLEGPLDDHKLTDVDGIDERAADRLAQKGWTVDTLFGQWCLFKKNRDEFLDFLAEQVHLVSQDADCCYECLLEYFTSHVL